MMLAGKQLFGLSVETLSGRPLGKIHDFALNPETHMVMQYTVRNTNPLKDFFGKEHLVSAAQVLSLTNEKMVVEDLVIREPETSKVAPEAEPVS